MRTLYCLSLSLFLFSNSAFADTLIMPKELVELGNEAGCAPINDFFLKRPGYVDPPYLYGYAPGTGVVAEEDEPEAVAFWCIADDEGHTEFLLVFGRKAHPWPGFSLADSAQRLPCPNVIRGHGNPGGLAVRSPTLTLDFFYYLDNPKQKGPKGVMPSHEVLSSRYDGAGRDYYCRNGRWMAAARD